ncbi:MAG: ATP-binding protein [Thermonemataceae bacterium]
MSAHEIYTHEATADLSESYSKPLNIKSLLNVPIRLNGKVIGILCLENKYTAREWMLEEINFAQTVANFLSLALESIERYRAEEELRQSSDKQLEMAEQLYLSNRELEENSLKIKAASSLAKLAPWSLELNIDGTGAKLNLSDEYYTILLKTDAETQGSHEIGFEEWMEKFVYKPDHEIVFGALGGVLENKEFDAEVTFRLIQSDDSIIYNKVIVSTKHYPEEGKIRGRGASQDVTETKNAEEKLAQALEDQKIINESMLVAQRELARKNEALKSSEEELRKMVEQQLETNEKLLIAEHETKEALKHEQESKKELDNTIDQLKDAQSQLVHNEKMASLGQLTAGFAHEINKPINFVYIGIDTLKISLDELLEIVRKYEMVDEAHNKDEILKEVTTLKDELDYDELLEDINYLVGDIKKGAVRTMEIVKGLRVFSRLDEEEKKMASVTDCIDSTLVLLNNKTKNKVAVNKFYDDAIPEINCYPGQLNQVFMNILSNAVQAIPDERKDGKIDIYTENLEANVVIRIKDNGKGMSEQVKRRIFEPFFTTKAVGVGTGLGLSISYGIIEKHDGDIYVNSEEGKGTEFVIRLPKDLA